MSSGFGFEVTARCADSHARTGVFRTPHGAVETPVFMPVGTKGTIKGVQPAQLRELGARMVLANTYHLHLRPGEETVAALGGLHDFMNWGGPILTDSCGDQVFSLAEAARISEDGVRLPSIVDGSPVDLGPESATDVQMQLGADVIMAFDHCPPDPLDRAGVEQATDRTHRWLERCVARWRERGGLESGQALFGIVQGGAFADLRERSVASVLAHDLVGTAIGGVSVGEDRAAMRDAVAAAAPLLPEDRPRYLMGVGTPVDFFDAIEQGVDMFDCVTPTRHGRTHQAFTPAGRINLRNRQWAHDSRPIQEGCDCPACAGFSRGYIRHLCKSDEMLGGVLISLHNLRSFHRLFERIRAAIPRGELAALRAEVFRDGPGW